MFKKYIRNEITYIYNLICSIGAHKKQQPSYVYDSSRGGGKEMSPNYTTYAMDSLGVAFDFIDCWIRCFEKKKKINQIFIVKLCESC